MNVPFTIPSNAELEKEFVSQAAKRGMVSSREHSFRRSGMRMARRGGATKARPSHGRSSAACRICKYL